MTQAVSRDASLITYHVIDAATKRELPPPELTSGAAMTRAITTRAATTRKVTKRAVTGKGAKVVE